MSKEVVLTDMEFSEDLARTTAYIYSELMTSPSFFSSIDNAMYLAKKFIEDFPSDTNWELMPTTWEETLYNFYFNYLKNSYNNRNNGIRN